MPTPISNPPFHDRDATRVIAAVVIIASLLTGHLLGTAFVVLAAVNLVMAMLAVMLLHRALRVRYGTSLVTVTACSIGSQSLLVSWLGAAASSSQLEFGAAVEAMLSWLPMALILNLPLLILLLLPWSAHRQTNGH